MNRDSNGKFTKKEENLELQVPNINTIIKWIVILVLLYPWFVTVKDKAMQTLYESITGFIEEQMPVDEVEENITPPNKKKPYITKLLESAARIYKKQERKQDIDLMSEKDKIVIQSKAEKKIFNA
jgi:hypothetical protein